MALFTEQFFADNLTLPYPEAAVVGHAYYAAPAPDLPLRLRIDFAPTIYADRYDGLRLRIVHLDKGPIDTAVLRFADHGAFVTSGLPGVARTPTGFPRSTPLRYGWGGRPLNPGTCGVRSPPDQPRGSHRALPRQVL